MKLKIVFLTFLLCFVLSSQIVLAADLTVSGKILDQNSNPIPQGVVVFVDASGKTIAAATSDMSGFYTVSVPQGTYTISAGGPAGSGLKQSTFANNSITSSSTRDFTLQAPTVTTASKATQFENRLFAIVAGFVVIAFIVLLIVLRRKKPQPPLPQPGSPN